MSAENLKMPGDDEADVWQSIDTLPDHVPEDDDLILAATDDGRRMIWRIDILKRQLKMLAEERQPGHLQFPATRWARLPPFGARSTIAIVDLAELERAFENFRQRIVRAHTKAWHAEARPAAERELADWLAARGVSLIGLTDAPKS